MLFFLIPIFLGIVSGIITGLIPGVHINLVSTFVLLLSPIFLEFFQIEQLVIFIISMGVIHSFLDFIPSIIFGVPNSDTALSVMPAHKLVIEGRGREALFLSASGSMLGAFFAIPIIIILFFSMPKIIPFVEPYISYALFVIVIWFLIEEKNFEKIFVASVFVIVCAIYGIILLNSYHLREPLLVIFTSIFGISTICYSIFSGSSGIPFQINDKCSLPLGSFKGIILGNICAAICSILPGVGNAQAASLITLFYKNSNSKIFLIITSSINTTSFLISIITLFLIEKARNGAIIVVSQLIESFEFEFLIILFLICYFLCVVGFILTRVIGSFSLDLLGSVNEKLMNIVLLFILFLIIFLIEGFYGIFVSIGISFLGYVALLLNIRKIHFMSILLVPVAIFLF